MNAPRVSVLMTVYNAGPYLDAAIRSIAGQTFRDWEFLIVDDASTDASREVIQGWAQRDARIRPVFNEANKGQTRCLNQGLALARGEWIARQDADDLSMPSRLERQLFAAGGLALIGTSGWIIAEDDRMIGLLDVPLSADGIRWTSPFLNPFLHTAVLFSVKVAREEFGGYNEEYSIAQDYDLWTRVTNTHRSANLAERLVCYRHLQASLSKAGRSRAEDEARRVSSREAARVFGEISEADQALINNFREGFDAPHRAAFWRFYNKRLRSFPEAGRTVALHHLWAAGALQARGNGRDAVEEMVAAFRRSPGTVLSWLRQRYFAFRKPNFAA